MPEVSRNCWHRANTRPTACSMPLRSSNISRWAVSAVSAPVARVAGFWVRAGGCSWVGEGSEGGTGGNPPCWILSSMSGLTAQHRGPHFCASKIGGTEANTPIAHPAPLLWGRVTNSPFCSGTHMDTAACTSSWATQDWAFRLFIMFKSCQLLNSGIPRVCIT